LTTAPLGLGLIGAGDFGTFCLEAYREMADVAVVAVADADASRAARIAPPGATVYADYAALLADPAVEAVHIATPPAAHGRMAREGAEAGKHLFMEKPLALTLEEGQAAVRAARDAGVKLSVNYVLRHHPLHRLALAIVAGEALGPAQQFALENFAADDNLPPEHWFWDPALSGGIHVEHGVHFFDLCNQVAGRPPGAISGCVQQRPDGRVDRVSATVRYGDELLATFYHSFNQIGRFERTVIRIGCARGQLMVEGWIPTRLTLDGVVDEVGLRMLRDQLGGRLEVQESFSGAGATFRHGGHTEHLAAAVHATAVQPDRQQAYKRAIQDGLRDLVAATQQDRPPLVGPADALLSLAVAAAASRSDSCGRPFEPSGLLP
jgi:predicted dehydrogenase